MKNKTKISENIQEEKFTLFLNTIPLTQNNLQLNTIKNTVIMLK